MVGAARYLEVQSFATETGWDFLTVNGRKYDGSGVGLNGLLVEGGTIVSWASDSIINDAGFKICSAGACSSLAMHVRVQQPARA